MIMTLDEVQCIKEQMSLETIGMSVDELNAYHSKGASEMQKRIEAIRNQQGTPLTIIRPEPKQNDPVQYTIVRPN